MNTLLIGSDNESRHFLEDALKLRRHEISAEPVGEADSEKIVANRFSLILFLEITEEALRLSRKLKSLDPSDTLTLVAILNRSSIHRFDEVLEAGFDQCIVESLFDEQRLDIRLAFAEKLARDKVRRSIVEQKLRESEARYRSIVETTVDAIITINEQGLIRTFNKAAEKLFLYMDHEVIGRNIKMLMPDPYRSEHDDYLQNYLVSGKRRVIGLGREVTGLRKNGSTFPMYLAVSETTLRDHRIFTGIVRDISEQRRLEQEILRTSEHERRRIGQDLHDGLGQMLTGIGLISKNISETLDKENHPLAEQTNEVTSLIREADQFARELARGLVPVELDSEGLAAALQRLTAHVEKLFRIQCRFETSGDVTFEDSTHVTHLYRIAQEAVSNAVKHGDATGVEIRLTGNNLHIRLRIDDNGSGFSKEWDKKGGLGVRTMKFRAGLIGASMDITESDLGGARITCTLPTGDTTLTYTEDRS